MQSAMKISPKWRHFRFSDHATHSALNTYLHFTLMTALCSARRKPASIAWLSWTKRHMTNRQAFLWRPTAGNHAVVDPGNYWHRLGNDENGTIRARQQGFPCVKWWAVSAALVLHSFDETFQRTHDAIITSPLRQNDVATSFWRNNDVVIALCDHWDRISDMGRSVVFLKLKGI